MPMYFQSELLFEKITIYLHIYSHTSEAVCEQLRRNHFHMMNVVQCQ
jgi:hypothetical protein